MRTFFNAKKIGLLASAAVLFLASCKKDSNNNGNNNGNNPPPASSSKIKKLSSGDESIEFAYGADGSVQTVKLSNNFLTNGNLMTFTASYNASKQISELKASDGTRIVAHYTGSELTSAEMFDDKNTLAVATRYTYEGGALKTVTMSAQGMDLMKFSFEYDAAGNVRKNSLYSFDATSTQLKLATYTVTEYDGKTNPLFAQKNLMALLFQNVSKNNTAKEVDYTAQNAVDETREYSYQYNNQNLPQSATMKTTAAGQQPTTTNILYSYQ